MAKLVSAAATSHAFALLDPSKWDDNRANNRRGYARRFGDEPPEHPNVRLETDDDIRRRYQQISGALDDIRDSFAAADLDVVLILGDDQNELFTEETYIPQLALYLGESFRTLDRADPSGGTTYRVNQELANHLYMRTVESGFDVLGIHGLPDNLLKSHAIGPVLARLVPNSDVAVIPAWIEGIHLPAPSPQRCYEFGRALLQAIESWPGNERIGVIASGGLSHFTAGYPYKYAPGATYGEIAADYDREVVVSTLSKGLGERFKSLTTQDLLDNGLIELRSWIAVAAMVGSRETTIITYEPFYRGIMGMGVAYWDLAKEPQAVS